MPATPDVLSVTRTKMSRQPGADATTVTWESDVAFTAYEIRAVPTAGSPVTAGTLIEANENPALGGTLLQATDTLQATTTLTTGGGNGVAGTDYSTEFTDEELFDQAGLSGTIIVKVFVRDTSGVWSA
jgi:hypothetical protein